MIVSPLRGFISFSLWYASLSAASLVNAQDFDFGASCNAFNGNQITFRDQHLGRSGRIEATVASIQDDGKVAWLAFFPRTAGSRQNLTTTYELMGSLYYAQIPYSYRHQLAAWSPGDLIEFQGSLSSIKASFKDEIRISGNTMNGYGYTYGGTVTVKTLIWSFTLKHPKRIKTIQSIVKEQDDRHALERAISATQQRIHQEEQNLLNAVVAGDVEKSRTLISQGVRYDAIQGKILLHAAVSSRAYRTTRLLLQLPLTDINAKDSDGFSSLKLAKKIGDFSLIELLKEYGASD